VLQLWATHYGAEAGVAALKYLPYGGLFLAGGMTPKLLDWIRGEDTPFMKAFLDQGRVTPLVSSIPVYAVLEEDIGQRGAHYVAFTVSFTSFTARCF
jgi:glucokinase